MSSARLGILASGRLHLARREGDAAAFGAIASEIPCLRPDRQGWTAPPTEMAAWSIVTAFKSRGWDIQGPPLVGQLYSRGERALAELEAVKAGEPPMPETNTDWEKCDACGEHYPDIYWADDDQWAAVVGDTFAGLRCPSCYRAACEAIGQEPKMKILAPPLKPVTPWEHQRRGYGAVLASPAVLLYMGVASGKTATCCWALRDLYDGRPILVTCSTAATEDVWAAQGPRWWPEAKWVALTNDKSVTRRTKAAREALADASGPVVIVINRESVWREPFGAWALSIDWGAVVADEGHRLKAPGGRLSRYMARLSQEIAPRGGRRIAMTGTVGPVEDCYGLFRFLDPGIYGEAYNRYESRYIVTVALPGGGKKIIGYQREAEWRERFWSITYHCGRDQLDLPDKHMSRREVHLPAKARRIYQELGEHLVSEISHGNTMLIDNALTKILKLLQVCGGTLIDEDGKAHRIGEHKAAALADILDSVDHPVVVFYRFSEEAAVIHEAIASVGKSSSELSGKRHELQDWKAGKTDVLVCQIQAGEDSIDLTRGQTVVYYSRSHSLLQREQSLGRGDRPNYLADVLTIIDIVVPGTVDATALDALDTKRDAIAAILDRPREMLFSG